MEVRRRGPGGSLSGGLLFVSLGFTLEIGDFFITTGQRGEGDDDAIGLVGEVSVRVFNPKQQVRAKNRLRHRLFAIGGAQACFFCYWCWGKLVQIQTLRCWICGIFGSFKNYQSAKDYATASLPSEVVQKTSLNLVQIPLNMVVDAFENSEWRVYARAGITYNLVANGSYVWRNGAQTDFNLLNNQTNYTSNSPSLTVKENNKSVTNYDANNSLSLNMGMGVAHRINRNISILIEPTYQHALKGIGTHSDLINTVSLTFGAVYAL